ncbi:response regulator transcription factor [Paenibacillus flagellatus]|uniref:DNA-binding response regulator n=1 Tax=Paenibacillus flagellatus TaxID=2211139 RepID=A0A2V5KC02_9BACL|nr:response regulator [Paenibacillus flagellatus]PYI57109.1 hypothetical protein DLM86_01295 [Paenibacillus flagellatus]
MYKVVLADDEPWILESLKGTLDWQASGYSIVGEAQNGVEAYELIASLNPDVAFIDIRMPGLNGLELIRKLYEAGSDTLCIVASGYAEFDYAKRAMQYGAVGYCLKPFDREEIAGLLAVAATTLERRRQAVRHELLLLLQERDRPPGAEVERLLDRLGFRWDREAGGAFVAVVRGKDAAAFAMPDGGPVVALRIGSGSTAYVIGRADRAGALARLEASVLPTAEGIGIGAAFADPGALRERIEEAAVASYRSFVGSGEAEIGEAPGERTSDALDANALRLIADGFERKDAKLALGGLSALEAGFRSGRYDIRHARRLYNQVLSSLYRTTNGSSESYVSGFGELASAFGTVYAMLDRLRREIGDSFAGAGGETGGRRGGEETFAQIVRYVRDRFREPISIQDISKTFYMHPNYVSQLFKKELRVTFTKYVTDIRMEYACLLLGTTGLTVSEIAEMAGYADYFYFARAFKKHTGTTPTEYRAKRGAGPSSQH